jgi:hypothetical protein
MLNLLQVSLVSGVKILASRQQSLTKVEEIAAKPAEASRGICQRTSPTSQSMQSLFRQGSTPKQEQAL